MSGESNLTVLLMSMRPILCEYEYVFCTVNSQFDDDYRKYEPIGIFHEEEGITLILRRDRADAAAMPYTSVFRKITLSVHSSLDAVGFLAAITRKLADAGMSVNPVSAYYHDHLFVPASRAEDAMRLLHEFSSNSTTTTDIEDK